MSSGRFRDGAGVLSQKLIRFSRMERFVEIAAASFPGRDPGTPKTVSP
jgi:hypothetical protein